jgi:hypothetical protein
MALKLEVGKTYLARNGHKATVVSRSPSCSIILRLEWRDADGPADVYEGGNHFSDERKHEWDLISEAPPIRTPCPTVPHAEQIIAAAQGKRIQQRGKAGGGKWVDLSQDEGLRYPVIYPEHYEYRVKPESVVRWLAVMHDAESVGGVYVKDAAWKEREGLERYLSGVNASCHPKILRLELDPDTLAVISATTEAP